MSTGPTTVAPALKSITLELIRRKMRHLVNPDILAAMELEIHAEAVGNEAGRMAATVVQTWFGRIAERHAVSQQTYPDGWWQAFKAEHFPGWALKRWPVKVMTWDKDITHMTLCPHLPLSKFEHHLDTMAVEDPEGIAQIALLMEHLRRIENKLLAVLMGDKHGMVLTVDIKIVRDMVQRALSMEPLGGRSGT